MSDDKPFTYADVMAGLATRSGPLNDAIHAAAARKLRSIARHKERLVTAWIAATDVHPEDAVMVFQEHGDGRTSVRVERRTDSASEGAAIFAIEAAIDDAWKKTSPGDSSPNPADVLTSLHAQGYEVTRRRVVRKEDAP